MKNALVIVDVQRDFLPGGALAVPNGDKVIPVINELTTKFNNIIATKDWHPEDHVSFKQQGGLWPNHCIRSTSGAQFPNELNVYNSQSDYPDLIVIHKGVQTGVDAYSGFYQDDKHNQKTQLDAILTGEDVDTLYITGLATDYCVKATVLDALDLGYKVNVVVDAIAGVNVNPNDSNDAITEMEKAGAQFIYSKDVEDVSSKKFLEVTTITK